MVLRLGVARSVLLAFGGDRDMLRELTRRQNEEGFPADHDVGVVGVVVHLGAGLHLQVVVRCGESAPADPFLLTVAAVATLTTRLTLSEMKEGSNILF